MLIIIYDLFIHTPDVNTQYLLFVSDAIQAVTE